MIDIQEHRFSIDPPALVLSRQFEVKAFFGFASEEWQFHCCQCNKGVSADFDATHDNSDRREAMRTAASMFEEVGCPHYPDVEGCCIKRVQR